MPDKKEFTVEMSPLVKSQMEKDPEIAKAIRDFIANCHQAQDGIDRGLYKSFDEAMEAITGNKPIPFDLEEDE